MESNNKIQVAESGNKRKAASVDDIKQAISDIKNWFKENHADYHKNKLNDQNGICSASK